MRGKSSRWIYVIATILAMSTLLPILWAVYTSLKPTSEVFQTLVAPSHLTFKSYTHILKDFPFAKWMLNSLMVAVIVTAGNLVINTLAGYAFARLRFPFRGFLFYVFLAIMMIPAQVLLVPMYILLAHLGWINTYQGLTVPFLLTPFMIFLARQFFKGVPSELEDSGRIGWIRLFWIVLSYLSSPSKAFISSRNDSNVSGELEFFHVARTLRNQFTYVYAAGWAKFLLWTVC